MTNFLPFLWPDLFFYREGMSRVFIYIIFGLGLRAIRLYSLLFLLRSNSGSKASGYRLFQAPQFFGKIFARQWPVTTVAIFTYYTRQCSSCFITRGKKERRGKEGRKERGRKKGWKERKGEEGRKKEREEERKKGGKRKFCASSCHHAVTNLAIMYC